jgi:hypothetical protein
MKNYRQYRFSYRIFFKKKNLRQKDTSSRKTRKDERGRKENAAIKVSCCGPICHIMGIAKRESVRTRKRRGRSLSDFVDIFLFLQEYGF